MDAIHDQSALRDLYGEINPLALKKIQPRLDAHSRAFIALSPFLVVATSDGAGGCDASPRGDAPGFVVVLDDTKLLLPDRRGNNRVDSFDNIVNNPGIALIFLVPGIDETLRVNGKARIVTDAALLAATEAQGKTPKAGLLVSVEEAFFQCGKALKRSHLWDPAQHVARDRFPTLGKIIAEQTQQCSVAEAEQQIASDYVHKLY